MAAIVINDTGNIFFNPLAVLFKNNRHPLQCRKNKMSVKIIVFDFHNKDILYKDKENKEVRLGLYIQNTAANKVVR